MNPVTPPPTIIGDFDSNDHPLALYLKHGAEAVYVSCRHRMDHCMIQQGSSLKPADMPEVGSTMTVKPGQYGGLIRCGEITAL